MLKHALIKNKKPLPKKFQSLFDNENKKIGISPFAQYSYKIYDLKKMEQVLKSLSSKGYSLIIFGGSEEEKVIASKWQEEIPNVISLIKQCTLSEELAIISNLDIMLSMDSSGMHLASLEGILVISIWGPTHPFAGFLGYGQSLEDCLQIDNPVRPTSVYGNKPCVCGSENCIDLITPEEIVKATERKLN
ncbi:MAG: glycosyltransferase family 9 protein [Arachidicoccus sp.]|nr:glycosyltransferase family 9 protein [Arachidicoccus sp.]